MTETFIIDVLVTDKNEFDNLEQNFNTHGNEMTHESLAKRKVFNK